jgi:hypothetical protein
MTSRQLLLLLLALVGIGILFTLGKLFMVAPASPVPSPSGSQVACTLDAKLCPDGSAVGRVGPNCEFAQCPLATSTSYIGKMTLALGEKGGTADVAITPLNVLEDSRCGINVVCIQAGTVRLRVELAAAQLNTTQQVMELGKSLTVGGKQVTLTQVSPSAYAGQTIATSSYRFTFEIK